MLMPARLLQLWVPPQARRNAGRFGRLGASWMAALCLVAGTAAAQQRTLQTIEVQPLSGQRLELRLRTDGPAPEPMSFVIDEPARISVDLPGTALGAARRQDVNLGPLRNIQSAEANGRTRV